MTYRVERATRASRIGLWLLVPVLGALVSLPFWGGSADMRLVAFMQYLRVVVVVAVASTVGRFASPEVVAPHVAWLAPVPWNELGVTLALAVFGGFVVPRYRIPPGPLVATMVAATLVANLGSLRFALPEPLLAASYLVLGWTIGLRFTREILSHARSALPRVLAYPVGLGTLWLGAALLYRSYRLRREGRGERAEDFRPARAHRRR